MKRNLRKTNKKRRITKKKIQRRKSIRKNRIRKKKRLVGGTMPFSGIQNLFSDLAYTAHNAILPLLNNTVDDKVVNPNPSVQFQDSIVDKSMLSGPTLIINK